MASGRGRGDLRRPDRRPALGPEPGEFPAKVVNTHSPALRMEGFFVDGARLAATGRITALPPKNARSAIYAAMLFSKYSEEIVAAGPPRLLFRALSAVGRTLGWRV